MKLIALSIIFGGVGLLLVSILDINGVQVSSELVFVMWTIGFFSPSIYVLDKLYKEIKMKKLENH